MQIQPLRLLSILYNLSCSGYRLPSHRRAWTSLIHLEKEYRGQDSNLHKLAHLILSQARLPIPPPRRWIYDRGSRGSPQAPMLKMARIFTPPGSESRREAETWLIDPIFHQSVNFKALGDPATFQSPQPQGCGAGKFLGDKCGYYGHCICAGCKKI